MNSGQTMHPAKCLPPWLNHELRRKVNKILHQLKGTVHAKRYLPIMLSPFLKGSHQWFGVPRWHHKFPVIASCSLMRTMPTMLSMFKKWENDTKKEQDNDKHMMKLPFSGCFTLHGAKASQGPRLVSHFSWSCAAGIVDVQHVADANIHRSILMNDRRFKEWPKMINQTNCASDRK